MCADGGVFSPDLTVKSAATPDFLLENLPETFIDWEDHAGGGEAGGGDQGTQANPSIGGEGIDYRAGGEGGEGPEEPGVSSLEAGAREGSPSRPERWPVLDPASPRHLTQVGLYTTRVIIFWGKETFAKFRSIN